VRLIQFNGLALARGGIEIERKLTAAAIYSPMLATTAGPHLSLGCVSPCEFERRWRAGNNRKEEPAS
jgi:hypothetical protein